MCRRKHDQFVLSQLGNSGVHRPIHSAPMCQNHAGIFKQFPISGEKRFDMEVATGKARNIIVDDVPIMIVTEGLEGGSIFVHDMDVVVGQSERIRYLTFFTI